MKNYKKNFEYKIHIKMKNSVLTIYETHTEKKSHNCTW